MNAIYIDPVGGIAGDMLIAALLDSADKKAENYLLTQLKKLELPIWQWKTDTVLRGGFGGKKIDFFCEVPQTERHLEEIIALIRKAEFPINAETAMVKTFELLADAEAKAHRMPREHVHFHEVGAVDTILDICGVCILLDYFHIEKIFCGPLPMGHGFVSCAHGEIPLPAPALNLLLSDVPVRSVSVEGETVTPTGMALLKAFQTEFCDFPTMTIRSCGCGCGTKERPVPNILRVYRGEFDSLFHTELFRLECTIDDMRGEDFGFLWEKIAETGANDMFYTPIFMKKGRPGIKITVLGTEPIIKNIESILFQYTTTLGILRIPVKRSVLPRQMETVDTPFGPVRYKVSRNGDKIRAKAEFEDLKVIALREHRSLDEIRKISDFCFDNTHEGEE